MFQGFQPRPDGTRLHHPPPSLANCGTAETGEIFRAVGGVWQGRCHQRRARRAERASFSAFVSNPDFRVPRLRQIGWRAADRAARRRKRGHPRDPESRPRLPQRSCPSTFWSRCGPGLDPGLRPGAWHPVAGRCFPCAYGEPESPTSPPTRPRSGTRHGAMTIETAWRASLEFVCIFGHDGVRELHATRAAPSRTAEEAKRSPPPATRANARKAVVPGPAKAISANTSCRSAGGRPS